MKRTLWLRHETKPFEERVALSPELAGRLLAAGHDVVVEKSPSRIFSDDEYRTVGCQMEETNSWISKAPLDATIFGLKELEEKEFSFQRRHIHFAHVFKNQDGAPAFFKRMNDGAGMLYDLEYLTDSNGKRVAAFGVWAGFTGAALGLDIWLSKQLGIDYNSQAPLKSFSSSNELVNQVGTHLREYSNGQKSKIPKILIIGARGRCGQGAQDFFKRLGLETTLWGSAETKNKEYISEILDFDILINCALMTSKVGPWLTPEMLGEGITLQTISDVSCDPTGPCNPIPVYPEATTMDKPVYTPLYNKDLKITAIDHLPSLLPRESSLDFSSQLYPHLLDYMNGKIMDGPWERALTLFYKNLIRHTSEEEIQHIPKPQDFGASHIQL
jgi:saccharopine dehydrogenase (NAD+, L-lysine-forming)